MYRPPLDHCFRSPLNILEHFNEGDDVSPFASSEMHRLTNDRIVHNGSIDFDFGRCYSHSMGRLRVICIRFECDPSVHNCNIRLDEDDDENKNDENFVSVRSLTNVVARDAISSDMTRFIAPVTTLT